MTRSGRRAPGRLEVHTDLVQVVESAGIRSLYLGSDRLQSSMRVADPVSLVLAHTRAMAAFLLFHEAPRRFLMIGLGGGSLVKFAYHHFPDAQLAVVECNARVIDAAHDLFCVPSDDARLRTVEGDGGEYTRRHPRCCDVLVLDAFDSDGIVPALATDAFYEAAHAALDDDGVFVLNLAMQGDALNAHLARLAAIFDGRVRCLPVASGGNAAVFAFRGADEQTPPAVMQARARRLAETTGLDLREFVATLAADRSGAAARLPR